MRYLSSVFINIPSCVSFPSVCLFGNMARFGQNPVINLNFQLPSILSSFITPVSAF